jgi:putative oxidoreductase
MQSLYFDRLAERSRDVVLLASRILLAVIFVPSGFGKLTHFARFADSLTAKGLPLPLLWSVAAVAAEFLGGLCVLLGLWTRPAALLMFVFTAATAVIGHPFWAADAAAYQMQFINFMKNVAIMGGFLALFIAGPGSVSLDKWFFGRR